MALAGHILQQYYKPFVIRLINKLRISFFVLLYILVSGTDIFLDYVWMPLLNDWCCNNDWFTNKTIYEKNVE
ncbi:MAG: hypothetical protein ACLRQF_04960 [Thomasclavelia ramosa]